MKTAVVALVSSAVLALALGFAHARNVSGVVSPPEIAATWSASKTEQLSLTGIQALYQDLDAQVAPVLSDSKTRQLVLAYLEGRFGAIHEAQKQLAGEVAAHHGCPGAEVDYVSSTTSWAIRKAPAAGERP